LTHEREHASLQIVNRDIKAPFVVLVTFIHSFIQALRQVSSTVYSEIMTKETVNKFRVITGRKSPFKRYHRAIQILVLHSK